MNLEYIESIIRTRSNPSSALIEAVQWLFSEIEDLKEEVNLLKSELEEKSNISK